MFGAILLSKSSRSAKLKMGEGEARLQALASWLCPFVAQPKLQESLWFCYLVLWESLPCPVEYLRRGLGGLDSAWEWLRSIKSTLLNIYYYGYKGVENTPRWLD